MISISRKRLFAAIFTFSFLVIASIRNKANASVSTFNLISSTGTAGTGNGALRNPRGIALDSSGNIFVADYTNNRIQKFNSSIAYVNKIGGTSCSTSFFCTPSDVAVDSSGNVYVVDTGYNRVRKVSNDLTTIIWTKGGTGTGSGNDQFNTPSAIAVDSAGYLYVADSYNYRVKKMDSDGNYITSWGSSGTGNGQFTFISGITVDPFGNIWVIDQYQRKMSKFTNTGTYLTSITKPSGGSTTVDTLNAPTEMVFDASGNIYVTDTNNNRIVKFTSSGTYLAYYGGITLPYGAAYAGGILYTTDLSATVPRIRKFDYTGTAYQVSSVTNDLNVVVQATGLNIETGGLYGITTASAVRLKTILGKTLSDFTLTLSADSNWLNVQGDSDIASGKSYVANLMTTTGISATHSLYVPVPNGRTSTTVRICPNATSLSDVSLSCTNGVTRSAGSYTETFGNITVSQVNNLGDYVTYWKIDGMTGSGGQADGLIEYSGSGGGTNDDPYLITTCSELQEMKDNLDAYWQITNNIDCTGTSSWNSGAGFIPIGASTNAPFTGDLVGDGTYSIDGLYISIGGTSGIGLFGNTKLAAISNVNLTNIHFVKSGASSGMIGGLVGRMDGGLISAVTVSGLIEQPSASGIVSNLGGLVGLLGDGVNTVNNCSSSVNINLREGAASIGGLVGTARGNTLIFISSATGNIQAGHSSFAIAGFIGSMMGNTSIVQSYASGSVNVGIDTGTVPSDAYYNAGFVGVMGNVDAYPGTTSITDSYATGNVTAMMRDTTTGYDNISYTAGFVGFMESNSSISGSYTTGSITIDITADNDGYYGIGGFAGLIQNNKGGTAPTITNSYTTRSIIAPVGDSGNLVGGFVGVHNAGTISLAYATGTITIGPSFQSVSDWGYNYGGFVGQIFSGNIEKSYTTSNLVINGSVVNVGGFTGAIANNGTGSITESYSTGNVAGTDWVGGFAGRINTAPTFTIANSYSRGNAYAYDDTSGVYVGGFMGTFANIIVQNVYATGTATALTPPADSGGLVGSTSYTATNSYWDTESSGLATSGGGATGLTTAQMKTASSYNGWDFMNIWSINPPTNDGYPQFRYDDVVSPSPTPSPSSTLSPSPSPSTTPSSTPASTPNTNEVSGTTTTINNHCAELPPLIAPHLFEATRKGNKKSDSVTLYYVPVNDRTTGYTVMYGDAPMNGQYSVSFTQPYATGSLSYEIEGLTPKQPYSFWMQAFNNCATGPWSEYLTVDSKGKTKEPKKSPGPVTLPTPSPSPTPTPRPADAVTTVITIVDDEGTPIEGATVNISPEANLSPSPDPADNEEIIYYESLSEILGQKTDQNGQLEVTLYPGQYIVVVTTEDTEFSQKMTISKGDSNITINIPIESAKDNIQSTATKITDTAIRTTLIGTASAVTLGTIATIQTAAYTLAPIYAETSRPFAKIPLDILAAVFHKLGQWSTAVTAYLFGIVKKRKKPIGQVFDGSIGIPLESTFLVFYSASGNLASTFSRNDGSYSVKPVPDEYNLRADKAEYSFPSQLVKVPSTPTHANIYLPGAKYTISVPGSEISDISIPLDPSQTEISFRNIVTKILNAGGYLLIKFRNVLTALLITCSSIAYSYHGSKHYLVITIFLCTTVISRFIFGRSSK